jgi:hypothetical protein
MAANIGSQPMKKRTECILDAILLEIAGSITLAVSNARARLAQMQSVDQIRDAIHQRFILHP